jgi:hypothetical protein
VLNSKLKTQNPKPADGGRRRPMLGLWFGNFFEPFFSDREAVRRGIAEAADLGFTSLNLDSKPWEDFFARYRGEPASPYVAMQEFMMQEAAARGLDYTHLALYLCGDNLYPTIRDVPPVRGEESIRPDGKPMGTYKYWSPRAQDTMVEHVRGLLKLYAPGMRRRDGRIIMQTMFEPIPKPSFDAEGRQRYLAWLERRYAGDFEKLKTRYGFVANGGAVPPPRNFASPRGEGTAPPSGGKSFGDLLPAEYWLRPEELDWVGCARPSAEEFTRRTPEFYRWIDNQTYLADELEHYLAEMKRRWRELEPALFVEPVLHQWGFFFNPPTHPMWQTGQRALDVYRCAKHVDGTLFIAAPLNAENRADAMALSVEGAIMRGANAGRSFTAGLYLGRHVNGDIYRSVPPAEAIGTLVAHGAGSLHVYGYSGLDDGGVLFRMDDVFKDSLRAGNRWAAEVIPLLDAPRTKDVAILFPREMSLYEPLEVDHEGRHRMDLLGWFAQCVDLGWHVDVVHPDQAVAGALNEYQHLVVPHNSLYDLGENRALEAAVKTFVSRGGNLYHGPHCEVARRALGVVEEEVAFDCLTCRSGFTPRFDDASPILARHKAAPTADQHAEDIIPHGWSTVAFANGTPLATYIYSGKAAIAETRLGSGRIVSFGFEYGYAYSRRTMPIVPPQYGKREMHPIVLLKETPVATLLGVSPSCPQPPRKGVEFARFGSQFVVVNHRASPIDLGALGGHRAIPQIPSAPGWLAAHSAVFIEN